MEHFKTTINSLETAFEKEKKRRQEEEQSSREVIEKAGSTAVEAFRSSETFMKYLGELTLSSFMFGYTTTIQDAASFLTPEQLDVLKDKPNYNDDAKELCDRMANGIQFGRDLAEVREEFNREIAEFEQASDNEFGGAAGGDGREGADSVEVGGF